LIGFKSLLGARNAPTEGDRRLPISEKHLKLNAFLIFLIQT
jgi:hypothetical protein